VERIENVEDTKGYNGDKGMLRITNIRLIWHANAMPRINLSIGYNSVHGVTTRVLKSVSFFMEVFKLYKDLQRKASYTHKLKNDKIKPI
jgi:hypothetical protein